MNSSIKLAELAADHELCKAVLAGVAAPFAVAAGIHLASSGHLLLHQQEDILGDDSFMVVLHVILRNGAVVLDPLLGQKVRSVGFLQQGITDVFLVGQDLPGSAWVPSGLACACEDAVRLQPGSDLVHFFYCLFR